MKRIICHKFAGKKLSNFDNFLGEKKLLLVHCAMALKLLLDVHCDTLSLVLISKLYSLEVSRFDAQQEDSVCYYLLKNFFQADFIAYVLGRSIQ